MKLNYTAIKKILIYCYITASPSAICCVCFPICTDVVIAKLLTGGGSAHGRFSILDRVSTGKDWCCPGRSQIQPFHCESCIPVGGGHRQGRTHVSETLYDYVTCCCCKCERFMFFFSHSHWLHEVPIIDNTPEVICLRVHDGCADEVKRMRSNSIGYLPRKTQV